MEHLEPCNDDRKKFDIDLEYGKVREKQVADMLQDKKIEVKSERGMWQNTGNIAIEYESYGKPSGINATEADLIRVCEDRIGQFKSPDRIHIMSELPKGPSGKIQRIKLAELVLQEKLL